MLVHFVPQGSDKSVKRQSAQDMSKKKYADMSKKELMKKRRKQKSVSQKVTRQKGLINMS